MKVRIVNLAQGRVAVIETDQVSMDIRLEADMPPAESLNFAAAALREQANRLVQRAYLMETAAVKL